MRTPRFPGALREGGFVLILVLWIIAFMLIGATYFAERISRATALALAARQDSQDQLDLFSTRAEILYRLAATPFTADGLGVAGEAIKLDDRPYRGDGETLVRLQDDRGLININGSAAMIDRLLAGYDIEPNRRAAMIDALQDYIDVDDLRRLNGAEKKEYEAADLPSPRNARLVTPDELRQVFGWGGQEKLWGVDGVARIITSGSSVAINPNTAPERVLALFPGMNADLARLLIMRRQVQRLGSDADLSALTGLPTSNYLFDTIYIPASSVRVTQSRPGQAWAISYNVEVTPTDANRPWRIDYYHRIPIEFRDDNLEKTASLPPRFVGLIPSPGAVFGLK